MNFKKSQRRFNLLTGEWILVSPQRTKRPWQGKVEISDDKIESDFAKDCYLCPGNIWANGDTNHFYNSTFVFENDFSVLKRNITESAINEEIFKAKSEKGICRVVCFSPKHNLILVELDTKEIVNVIRTLQNENSTFSSEPYIKYVQIFEIKGGIMGCSNPHPHVQI